MDQKNEKSIDKSENQVIENQEKSFSDYIQAFKNKKGESLEKDPKYAALVKEHKFWDTQPVPKITETPENISGPISESKRTFSDLTKLPADFKWKEIDLCDDNQIQLLYQLLYENYVEDDEGEFRFNYSIDFLRWALLPPNSEKDLYFGITHGQDNKLVGFISGLIVELEIEGKHVKASEVNFLCVKKEFRSHSMASVLIKELVRRSNLLGVWQGIYTSGTLLPTPFSQARYYHRNLNFKKLTEVRFSYLPPNQKLSVHEKLYELPECRELSPGMKLRETRESDLKAIRTLLLEKLKKSSIHQSYSKKETAHWFTHRPGILESYVIETNGKITDFFCFYCICSSILNNKKYKEIKAAYSYYFVNGELTTEELYQFALLKAKENGYDVLNALDIMDNPTIFENLKFKPGDGYLNYYLYNWRLSNKFILPSQIGIVLM